MKRGVLQKKSIWRKWRLKRLYSYNNTGRNSKKGRGRRIRWKIGSSAGEREEEEWWRERVLKNLRSERGEGIKRTMITLMMRTMIGSAMISTLHLIADLTLRMTSTQVGSIRLRKSSGKRDKMWMASESKRPTFFTRTSQHHQAQSTKEWRRHTLTVSRTSPTIKKPIRDKKMVKLSSPTYTIQWTIIMRDREDPRAQLICLTSMMQISSR